MFAYISYHDQSAKTYYVPRNFIKDFYPKSTKDFEKAKTYKVFWCPELLENQENVGKMKEMKVPPKETWEKLRGTSYYGAYILRLGANFEDLMNSVKQKRPIIPPRPFQINNKGSSSSSDEGKKKDKGNKNQENKDSSKLRMKVLLDKARKERKDLFAGTFDKDTQQQWLETISELEAECAHLQKEIDKANTAASFANKRILELERECVRLQKEKEEVAPAEITSELEAECACLQKEVDDLRSLNRSLQQEVLDKIAQGNLSCNSQSKNSMEATHNIVELPEDVDLGNNVSLKRAVYNAVKSETNVSRFTKSLCVAIWGIDILRERSIKGQECRNPRGCKRKVEDEADIVSVRKAAKKPLTPEKLAVVDAQMREYMKEKGMGINEIQENIKKRNRLISQKIADLNKAKRNMNCE